MRAKFQVVSVVPTLDNAQVKVSESVKFMAVCGEGPFKEGGFSDDNTFAKWTPMASCEMTINNPALWETLIPGQKYYVDFTLTEQ